MQNKIPLWQELQKLSGLNNLNRLYPAIFQSTNQIKHQAHVMSHVPLSLSQTLKPMSWSRALSESVFDSGSGQLEIGSRTQGQAVSRDNWKIGIKA